MESLNTVIMYCNVPVCNRNGACIFDAIRKGLICLQSSEFLIWTDSTRSGYQSDSAFWKSRAMSIGSGYGKQYRPTRALMEATTLQGSQVGVVVLSTSFTSGGPGSSPARSTSGLGFQSLPDSVGLTQNTVLGFPPTT